MEEREKILGELLRELREDAGVSQEEFSRQSRIPLHFIQALEETKLDQLPPDSYLRGLLKKYLKYFGGDEEAIVTAFEAIRRKEMSGPRDALPQNRFAFSFRVKFALPKVRWHPAYGLLLLILLYLFFEARALFLPPAIELQNPSRDSVVGEASMVLAGHARGARKVFVNGEELPLSRRGEFSFDLPLREGLNSIEVVARNYLGRESKISRYVSYQPARPSPSPALPSPFPFPGTVPRGNRGTETPPMF